MAHLAMDATIRAGAEVLEIAFALRFPWSVLFGVSGSGKSTTLRAIMGLVQPERGRIQVGGQTLVDTDVSVCMASHRRPVRLSPQQPSLFRSRTIRDNLRFGGGTTEDLYALAELLGLSPLLDRKPDQLSGGEQQRVNLGRAALAASASRALLLLDEPFTGVDGSLRDRVAPALQQWLLTRGVNVLSVTHDLDEVFLLKPEVLRLENGRITDQGPASVVLRAERDRLLRRLQETVAPS